MDGPAQHNGGLTLNRSVGLGTMIALIELVVVIGGGFWAVGKMEGKIDAITEQIIQVRLDMKEGQLQLKMDFKDQIRDLSARLNTLTSRVDQMVSRNGVGVGGVGRD